MLTPGFYAKGDLRTPVKVAVGVLLLTQLLNLVFVPRLGHAGLALSIGVAALVNAGALLIGLWRRGSWQPQPGWGRFGLQVLAGSAGLGLALDQAARRLDWIALGQQEGLRTAWLAGVLLAAGLGYLALLAGLGLRLRAFARRG